MPARDIPCPPANGVLLRMTACTYVSGAVCLTANNMFSPRLKTADSDDVKIDVAFSFFSDFVDQVPFDTLQNTRNVWGELRGHARTARQQALDAFA